MKAAFVTCRLLIFLIIYKHLLIYIHFNLEDNISNNVEHQLNDHIPIFERMEFLFHSIIQAFFHACRASKCFQYAKATQDAKCIQEAHSVRLQDLDESRPTFSGCSHFRFHKYFNVYGRISKCRKGREQKTQGWMVHTLQFCFLGLRSFWSSTEIMKTSYISI